MTAPVPHRTPRVVLPVLAVGLFGAYLGYATISPLLPAVSRDFGISDALAGQSATIALIAGFLVTLAVTPFMDRRPPRWWLFLLALIMIASAVISAWSPTFQWFVVGRVLSGIGISLLTANIFAAAREAYHDPVTRNRALGIISSAGSCAVLIGLPIVTLLGSRYGWRVGMASIAVPFLILAAGALAIPRPESAPNPDPIGAVEAYRSILSHREAVWILICFTFHFITYNGWLVFFGAFATESRGLSPAQLSAVFLAIGITELIFSNVAPRLVERFGLSRVIIVGLFVNAAPLLLSFLIHGPIVMIIAISIFSLGGIVSFVALYARVLAIDHAQSGSLLAMVSAASGLGSGLGPLIAGWIIATTDSYNVAYIAMGCMLLLGILAYLQADRAARATPHVSEPVTA